MYALKWTVYLMDAQNTFDADVFHFMIELIDAQYVFDYKNHFSYTKCENKSY